MNSVFYSFVVVFCLCVEMQGQENVAVAGPADHRLALIHEMSAQNFDLIRFASYRTAMKLRFIQKKVSRKL